MNNEQTGMPLISIVIPNLNGRKHLSGCLSSIYSQDFKDFEVIVIDNGSTDGSVEYIKDNFPQTIIIGNDDNLGFAMANNQGIEIAKGKYIATLNNDTVADKDWLKHIVAVAESSATPVGMWAPKILSLKQSEQIDSVGGLLIYCDGIAKGRGRLEKDTGQYNNERDILFPSACCALYRKKMLDEVGYFDEDFFAYCEDTDLGLRARLSGWRALSVPEAIIYHYYSGTGGEYSDMKAFLVERNHFWVAVKNFPLTWLIKLPFCTFKRYIFQMYEATSGKGSAAKFISSHSIKHILTTLIKAYTSALTGLPSIIKKRRKLNREISNREFVRILKENRITAREVLID
jgi:GT2 family glycosyltransferase